MVEMRWVERRDQHYRDGLPQGHGPVYKVLQYRRMRKGFLMLDKDDNPMADEWSEWIDVPTVTEG